MVRDRNNTHRNNVNKKQILYRQTVSWSSSLWRTRSTSLSCSAMCALCWSKVFSFVSTAYKRKQNVYRDDVSKTIWIVLQRKNESRKSPALNSSVLCFFQLGHDALLEVEDRQQPFQSLPKVVQELILQIHRPCLVAKTTPDPRRNKQG